MNGLMQAKGTLFEKFTISSATTSVGSAGAMPGAPGMGGAPGGRPMMR